jgi:hypothetical protein
LSRFRLLALAGVALLPFAVAQTPRAQAPASPPVPATQIEANRKALNAIFQDYWEDYLKHSPEFASARGDKRYNDQISDYSVKAVNDGLARKLRAGATRTQHRNGHVAALARNRPDWLPRLLRSQVTPQLRQTPGKAPNFEESSPFCPRFRPSARIAAGSPPGARPTPRSMHPGYSASSVPNCSATTSVR